MKKKLLKTNLELYHIGWTTLFKDFCNNTSVFVQQHSVFLLHFAYLQHVPSTLWLNGIPLTQKHYVMNTRPQPTSMIKKRDVTNMGHQPTFMIEERDVTNTGPQPTSMIKTSQDLRMLSRRVFQINTFSKI